MRNVCAQPEKMYMTVAGSADILFPEVPHSFGGAVLPNKDVKTGLISVANTDTSRPVFPEFSTLGQFCMGSVCQLGAHT